MEKNLEVIGQQIGCSLTQHAATKAGDDHPTAAVWTLQLTFPELAPLAELRRPGEDVAGVVKRVVVESEEARKLLELAAGCPPGTPATRSVELLREMVLRACENAHELERLAVLLRPFLCADDGGLEDGIDRLKKERDDARAAQRKAEEALVKEVGLRQAAQRALQAAGCSTLKELAAGLDEARIPQAVSDALSERVDKGARVRELVSLIHRVACENGCQISPADPEGQMAWLADRLKLDCQHVENGTKLVAALRRVAEGLGMPYPAVNSPEVVLEWVRMTAQEHLRELRGVMTATSEYSEARTALERAQAVVSQFLELRAAIRAWCDADEHHYAASVCGDSDVVKASVARYNAAHEALRRAVGRPPSAELPAEWRGCVHRDTLDKILALLRPHHDENVAPDEALAHVLRLLAQRDEIAGEREAALRELSAVRHELSQLQVRAEDNRDRLAQALGDLANVREELVAARAAIAYRPSGEELQAAREEAATLADRLAQAPGDLEQAQVMGFDRLPRAEREQRLLQALMSLWHARRLRVDIWRESAVGPAPAICEPLWVRFEGDETPISRHVKVPRD